MYSVGLDAQGGMADDVNDVEWWWTCTERFVRVACGVGRRKRWKPLTQYHLAVMAVVAAKRIAGTWISHDVLRAEGDIRSASRITNVLNRY